MISYRLHTHLETEFFIFSGKFISNACIGKTVGDELDFGGLLGGGPVMDISKISPAKFISRGGRIPAPVQSLKN